MTSSHRGFCITRMQNTTETPEFPLFFQKWPHWITKFTFDHDYNIFFITFFSETWCHQAMLMILTSGEKIFQMKKSDFWPTQPYPTKLCQNLNKSRMQLIQNLNMSLTSSSYIIWKSLQKAGHWTCHQMNSASIWKPTFSRNTKRQ